jgi:hypothetical protein
MKKFAVMIALSACLSISLASTSSAKDRQEMREAAGVESGDRIDRRGEVRESVEMDAGDRKEVREAANVEAGDRIDRRGEVRESID